MKIMGQVYAGLTPVERFRAVMDAFDRLDLAEIDRLHAAAPMRQCTVQEPDYFGRISQAHMLAAHLMLQARNVQARVLAGIGIVTACVRDLKRPDLALTDKQLLDARIAEFIEICGNGIAVLKAIEAAWTDFCREIGIAPSAVSRLWGESLLGSLGCFDVILEEVPGNIERDEGRYLDLLDRLRDSWTRHVERRDLVGT
jgi:hypothetical protein